MEKVKTMELSKQKRTEAEENRIIFEELPMGQALTRLAVPAIISQLIILIYNMADTFFIGRTGNALMVAGASLILPVFNITVSLAGLVGVGGGSLISRLLGAGREKAAGAVSAFSFYLAILIAAVFSAGMYVFMDPVLRLLGASRDTIGFARQYALCVLVAGGLPAVVSMTLANLLRSVGCSKQAGFGVSMGGLLNIALDPLFMFVLFPKGMEIVGAGTATALSNAVSCLYFLLVLRRMGGRTALNLSPRQGLPGKAEIASIFEVGVPSALAVFLFDLAYIVIDKLMTGYGDIPLAAVGIVLKAERLPLNVGIGLCQGMMPIAGYNYSAGNFKRMKEAVRVSRLAGLAAGAVSVILYQIFAGQIMGFFIAEEQTVALGTAFLRARCLATPFMFLSFHLVNLFQAVGKGGIALFLASVRWAVFNIPMLVIFNWLFGMYGIVWTQVAADILTVLVSFYVFYRFEERERAESFQARTAPSARH